jgi:hypothetical protein
MWAKPLGQLSSEYLFSPVARFLGKALNDFQNESITLYQGSSSNNDVAPQPP